MGACKIHGTRYWVESVPAGHGYCQECARKECDRRGITQLGDNDGPERRDYDQWSGRYF